MFTGADCQEARSLADSVAMKVVLAVKIGLNITAACQIVAVVRMCRRRKLFVMHRNIRILLFFHFYYVIHVAVFMTVGLTTDLIRLSLRHDNDCDYLIPVWLTFPIKCSFVFGVFAETITIALISIERLVATYYPSYEMVQCKLTMPALLVAKVLFVFAISYVLLGYEINWSDRLVVFTFRTEANDLYYEVYITYTLATVEVCSIVLYHFTLWVNHRETSALLLTKSREDQIVKTLSQKYQMEENTKVIRLVLPIVWSHFVYVIVFGACKTIYSVVNGNIRSQFFAIYTETITTNVYYAITMSILFLAMQGRGRKTRSTVDIVQKTGTYGSAEDYHKQLHTIFTSHLVRPGNTR